MAAATSTPHRVAAKPFYFNTAAHLLRITRQKAATLAELLEALRECPEESIFQHTFRTLQEHHFIRQGFSNDFAQWALSSCKEPGLGNGYLPWTFASSRPWLTSEQRSCGLWGTFCNGLEESLPLASKDAG